MKIKKAPIVSCSKCREKINTEIEEYGEPDVRSESRNMGSEKQYVWNLQLNCTACQNEIDVKIEGYEYPEGILNYENTSAEGGIIITEAQLQSDIS